MTSRESTLIRESSIALSKLVELYNDKLTTKKESEKIQQRILYDNNN